MRTPALLVIILVAFSLQLQAQFVRQDEGHPVAVYPNPASDDYVYIRLSEPLDAYSVHLTLYNIIGNQVGIDAEVISERELRIRIKDLASGYYLLGLREEKTRFKGTYKFLKR